MRLTIPTIGETLVLTKPWSFEVYQEYRQQKLFEYLGWTKEVTDKWGTHQVMNSKPNEPNRHDDYEAWQLWNSMPYAMTTFPVGTPLKVARIYIRHGAGDFDSVTFSVVKNSIPGPKHKGFRFWAKLADVNRIEFEFG